MDVDNHLNLLIFSAKNQFVNSKKIFRVKFYFWEYFNNFEVL
jgi:hypothetical protein